MQNDIPGADPDSVLNYGHRMCREYNSAKNLCKMRKNSDLNNIWLC